MPPSSSRTDNNHRPCFNAAADLENSLQIPAMACVFPVNRISRIFHFSSMHKLSGAAEALGIISQFHSEIIPRCAGDEVSVDIS
jgi:hypothetical protein